MSPGPALAALALAGLVYGLTGSAALAALSGLGALLFYAAPGPPPTRPA